jgi:Putative peptidoglycan binding domain
VSNPKNKRRVLTKGVNGEDVRDAQRKLNARRANMLDESGNRAKEIDEDGKFGNETEKAVLLFQRRNRLPDTGKIDDRTWDALNTVLGVFTVSILDYMFDDAEKALKARQGGASLRMRQDSDAPESGSSPVPPTSTVVNRTHSAAAPAQGDRIYQVQGGSGRTYKPLWTRPGGWDPTGTHSVYSRSVQVGAVWRTSQEDRHAEYGPYLQLQQNWDDPQWSIMAGFQLMYADLLHLGPWHLASLYVQPSVTLPVLDNRFSSTLTIGHQASVDLSKNGNLSFFVQDQIAMSLEVTSGHLTLAPSVVLGFSINLPAHLPKSRQEFWKWW